MQAAAEAQNVGSRRVSIWRRGVTSNALWDSIRLIVDGALPACARSLEDGCLLKEKSSPDIWVVLGRTRYHVRNEQEFGRLGLSLGNLGEVPDGFLNTISPLPPDGSLLRDEAGRTWLAAGGARLPLEDNAEAALPGGAEAVITVPIGSVERLATVPANGVFLKEVETGREWVTAAGARFEVANADARAQMIAIGRMYNKPVMVPAGSLSGIPLVPRDGTQIREVDDSAVYQVVGGARLWVSSPEVRDQLVAQGAMSPGLVAVPPGSLGQVGEVPATGTLVRPVDGTAVSVIVLGARYWAPSISELDEVLKSQAITNRTVVPVDPRSLASLPRYGSSGPGGS
jgi:hypothetical protein